MKKSTSTKLTIAIVLAIAIGFALSMGFNNSTSAVGEDDDIASLEKLNRAFKRLANQATPAVVQIRTTKMVKYRYHNPFDFFDDPFDFFRRQPPQERGRSEEREVPGGLGSGVIVDKNGYILTNNHVIANVEKIVVTLPDKREFDAELIGRDQWTDIALIKISGENLPNIPIGNSDEVEVGEWVIAIGSPFSYAHSVTHGIVSATGRSVGLNIIEQDFIQTDAPINPGNSGGPLINIRGELIGINTAIAGSGFSQQNAGVGFAIPINLAKRIMEDLKDDGKVVRGYLGVLPQEVTHGFASKLGLKEVRGALVAKVEQDTPAEKAGMKRGDVIVEFDGEPIRDDNHLRTVVASTEIGKTVKVKVIRKGEEKILQVKVAERDAEALASAESDSSTSSEAKPLAGLRIANLTPEEAQKLGYEGDKGVIIREVKGGSPAAGKGLEAGDLIMEIEWEPVRNVREYRRLAKKYKDENKIILYVKNRRNGIPAYVALEAD